MSAIFGIINKKGDPVDKDMIEKMQASLLHRAVDGKGIYAEGAMMFGHHKLNVHRRQAQETQPLVWEDYVINCDARIDNIDELFIELGLVQSIENYTDPFIILQAYKKWRNDCVNHLEGEFCFFIWDKNLKAFLGASDHVGFNTFYYYENYDMVVFASEIKAIEAVKTEPLVINKDVFSLDPSDVIISYDTNIKILPASHLMTICEKQLHIERYWVAKKTKKYKFKNAEEWQQNYLKLVERKVASMLDTSSPVGISLSGGLDSSFIAAVACKHLKVQNKKLHAFCSVLPENYKGHNEDERVYIEKMKEMYDNLEVHYVTIPENEGFYSNLEESFKYAEGPLTNFHYVDTALYREAQKHNIRSLLTGFGGDETVSSKGHGVIFHYLTHLQFLKAASLFYRKYKLEGTPFIIQLKAEVFRHINLYNKISSIINAENYTESLSIIKQNKNIHSKNLCRNRKKNSIPGFLNSGVTGFVLFNSKKYAQSFQIEYLAPLYSKDIFEYFLSIPKHLILHKGVQRSFLKETMRNLVPREILSRKDKISFSPDHDERLTNFDQDRYKNIEKNKLYIEEISPLKFSLMEDLLKEFKNDKNFCTSKNLDIPFMILRSEFAIWLKTKTEGKVIGK